nr:proteasome subunit alpha type-1 [Tanacetum cinerariifolium]
MGRKNKTLEESKAEDEANVKDTSYPWKEDGLDSLSFMAWAKAVLMTFSKDMLIRRSQTQSLCSYAFTLSRPSKKDPPLGDVGEKPKSEKLSKPMAQRFSPPSSGANTVCYAALITRSRGTLLGGLHEDSQSEVFNYAIFISSKTGLGVKAVEVIAIVSREAEAKGLQRTFNSLQKVESQSSAKALEAKDKDSLKVLTELPRSQSMKVLALLVGSLVIVVMKNEGALLHFHDIGKDHGMRKRKKRCKGKSWELLLSINKWSRQRASLKQKAASCKHYSKSSELRNKSKASRGSLFRF